jgi:hypothetical protein
MVIQEKSAQLNRKNSNAVLNNPTDTYFATVNFASYGTPDSFTNFTIRTCHSNIKPICDWYLLGNSCVTVPATNGVFGDPCVKNCKTVMLLHLTHNLYVMEVQ